MTGNCHREGCLCTHTDPCDYGWIPMPPIVRGSITYERVGPCPTCRPELALRADSRRKDRP